MNSSDHITPAADRSSARLRRTHLPERADVLGMSVRAADQQLGLDGAGHGLLDTTHFDTVRFPPPPWALPDFVAAAQQGEFAYTSYRGNADVRRTCAPAISALLGVAIDGERHVVLSPGTQGGLFGVLSALVDDGDTVVLTDPEYLFVERMLRFLGATVVRLPFTDGSESADGPQPDLDALARIAAGGVRLMLTSNPNNPTGTVYSPATVQGIADLAIQHDFLVVVDELYCRLVYDDTPVTHLAALPGMFEHTVTMLGGSKTESLSGYRVGVIVAPAPIADAVEQVMAMTCLRAPAYAQHVLRRWLIDDHEFVRTRVGELRALREMSVAALRSVPGLRVRPGAGTAYLWPDVSALGRTDIEVAKALQVDAGLVVSPGYQFGPAGLGHFRICYARDEVQWQAALARMTSTLAGLAR